MWKKKYIVPLMVFLAVCIGFICITLQNREPDSLKEAEIPHLIIESDTATEPEDPYDLRIDFAELQKENPDIYAWIKVPGTNIDYPILQSAEEEDEYYLNHTAEKKEGFPGSIYTEKYNATDFSDPVTVIYGHTLKDGTMFSELKKYRDKEFFESNPSIYIYLPTGRLTYQIFAAVAFDDRYLLGSYDFGQAGDVEDYIADLKRCNDGNFNPHIAISDEMITLSTCIGTAPDKRWLVCAVMTETQRY